MSDMDRITQQIAALMIEFNVQNIEDLRQRLARADAAEQALREVQEGHARLLRDMIANCDHDEAARCANCERADDALDALAAPPVASPASAAQVGRKD